MSDQSSIEWTDVLKDRFWANVDKNGPTAPGMDTPCWIWTAGLFSGGYGQFRAGARKVRAHRAAYDLASLEVPSGLILRHRCDVRRCCRPDHLEPGTNADNSRDCVERGRVSRLGHSSPGESNPSAKLTRNRAIEIRVLRTEGVSRDRVAADYGVSPWTVRAIEQHRIWSGLGTEDYEPEVAHG